MRMYYHWWTPLLLMCACNHPPETVSHNSMVNISYYSGIRQEIDGFGGSNAWVDLPSNTDAANEVVKLLYSKSDNTYQYTIDENGIKTFTLNWNNWDLANTRKLISRINALGADGPEQLTVMSTPWTPPNNRVTQWRWGNKRSPKVRPGSACRRSR